MEHGDVAGQEPAGLFEERHGRLGVAELGLEHVRDERELRRIVERLSRALPQRDDAAVVVRFVGEPDERLVSLPVLPVDLEGLLEVELGLARLVLATLDLPILM